MVIISKMYYFIIVDQVESGGGRDDKLEVLREGNDCICTTYSTSL